MDSLALTIDLFASSLSFFGCLYTFYLISQRRLGIGVKMIAFLTLGDFLFTISNFFTPFSQNNEGACLTEGFLREFGVLFSSFWAGAIALFSFWTLKSGVVNYFEKFKTASYYLGFAGCGLIALFPFFGIYDLRYGFNGIFCWIAPSNNDLKMIFILMIFQILPIISSLIVSLVSYKRQINILNGMSKDILDAYNIKTGYLYWFPAGFFICFIPAFLDFMFTYIFEEPLEILLYLHLAIGHSLGFVNAYIYNKCAVKNSNYNNKESIISDDGLDSRKISDLQENNA